MVHALEETQRVLRPGGKIIDLRPTTRQRVVEVVLGRTRLQVGEIDAAASNAGRVAADRALDAAQRAGLLRLEHKETFWYMNEMDSLADLRDFAKSLRRTTLPAAVMDRVQRLVADEGDDYSIRIPREIAIARYRSL